MCTKEVIATLFCTCCMYTAHLWCYYSKILWRRLVETVAYNNAYRILDNLTVDCSASDILVNNNVRTCSPVIRKLFHSQGSMWAIVITGRPSVRPSVRRPSVCMSVRQQLTSSPKPLDQFLWNLARRCLGATWLKFAQMVAPPVFFYILRLLLCNFDQILPQKFFSRTAWQIWFKFGL